MNTIPTKVSQAIQNAVIPVLRTAGIVGTLMLSVGGYAPITFSSQALLPVYPPPATVLQPKTPTKVIYVSAAGTDSNTGATLLAPVKSVPVIRQSGTAIYFRRGDTFVTNGILFNGFSDCSVDCYGDNTLPLPVLIGARAKPTDDQPNIFSWSPECARTLVRNIRCTSIATPAKTAGGYAYSLGSAAFGNPKGTDVTVDGVEFDTLTEGVSAQGVVRMLVQNTRQVNNLGMLARCLMVEDCTDLTCLNNVWTNSINQSPLRTTDKGAVRAIFQGNTITQLRDATHGRGTPIAAVTFRQAQYIQFIDNAVAGGDLSFNTDDTGKETVTESYISGGTITDARLGMHVGAKGVSVFGLTINNSTGSECVCEEAGLVGNTYNGLILSGASTGIKFYAASNAAVSNVQWSPSSPGLPLVKGVTAGITDGGGCMVAGVATQL